MVAMRGVMGLVAMLAAGGCGFSVTASGTGTEVDAAIKGDGSPDADRAIDAGCLSPAAEWRFDEGAGTTAADSSGRGNALTLHAAGWGTGKQGGALELLGNTWADRPFAPAFVARRTLSATAWVNPAESRFGGIVVKSARLGPLMDWGFYVSQTEAAVLYNYQLNMAYPSATTTSMAIPLNAWTHLGFVVDVDSQTITFYKNGARFQVLPITVELAQHDTEPISVGTDGGNSANDFVGRLDEITVWTRVLSDAEIATLFAGDCLR